MVLSQISLGQFHERTLKLVTLGTAADITDRSARLGGALFSSFRRSLRGAGRGDPKVASGYEEQMANSELRPANCERRVDAPIPL